MSEQYPPQDPTQPPVGWTPQPHAAAQPAPKKSRRWPWWIAVAAALIVGYGAGSAGGGNPTVATTDPTTGVTSPAATAKAKPVEAPPPPPEPTYATPKPVDFKLTVKELSKECFGSAGCNITYRVFVAYSGKPLDPSKTWEVLYEVKGGDEPLTNTLTVTGAESSVDEEEFISTKSKNDKLSAVVTEVL